MFAEHNDWIDTTCYYVAAIHRMRMALLAGPYRTQAEAEVVLPVAEDWALHASGDPAARSYRYTVFTAHCGHNRSILGEMRSMKPGGFTRFDTYEIHGIIEFGDGASRHCEQVADEDAQFWSLYGHIPGEGLECIGDFKTRKHAEEVYARITGGRYAG